MVEWVDHLHEHFTDPVIVRDGRYRLPTAPGYSIEMLPGVARASSRSRTARAGPRPGARWTVDDGVGGRGALENGGRGRGPTATGSSRLALVALRAGPCVDPVAPRRRRSSLTTPMFFTSRNIGNVFSQTR